MPRYACGHRVGHDHREKRYGCENCLYDAAKEREYAIIDYFDERIAQIEDWKDPMYGNALTSM